MCKKDANIDLTPPKKECYNKNVKSEKSGYPPALCQGKEQASALSAFMEVFMKKRYETLTIEILSCEKDVIVMSIGDGDNKIGDGIFLD